jgi:DNA-binding protein YbaB
MLTDMIVVACNKAYDDVDKTTEEKMAKYQALLKGFPF